MKTILLLTLLSLNNPKDTTNTTCIKKKSCCKQKLNDSPKYCVGLVPNDSLDKVQKKSCCKKKKK